MSIVSKHTQVEGRHALDIGESVRYLRESIGLTEVDLAEATAANARTVRRWSSRETEPQARYQRPIDDLRAIVSVLEDSLTPKGIRQWLKVRNRYLKNERPITLLGRGEFDRVYAAATAFAEGVYI